MKIQINSLAKQVLDDLSKQGDVYFVGGIVRDTLLHVPSKDIDIEVHHMTYDELYAVLEKYGHVNTFGKSFAVIQLDTLPGYEFALPRKEIKIGEGHKDFDILIDPELSLEESCIRRDFTMNAMMVHYQSEELYDFYHGYDDLQNKVLRMIDKERFQEDPLRVYRAASFMSRYELTIDEETFQTCLEISQSGTLETLSLERVEKEYEKILMGIQPSLGLNFLRDILALPKYLEDLTYCDQRPDFHPEGNVWNHTMLVVDLASLIKDDTSRPLDFMWGALLHDIGKPAVTTPEGHAWNHDRVGAEIFMKDVPFVSTRKRRMYVKTIIKYHMELMSMTRRGGVAMEYLKLLKKIDGILPIQDLIWITRCDKMGRQYLPSAQMQKFNAYMDYMMMTYGDKAQPAIITGKDLLEAGFVDQKEYSQLLEKAYIYQLKDMGKEKILRRLKDESRDD